MHREHYTSQNATHDHAKMVDPCPIVFVHSHIFPVSSKTSLSKYRITQFPKMFPKTNPAFHLSASVTFYFVFACLLVFSFPVIRYSPLPHPRACATANNCLVHRWVQGAVTVCFVRMASSLVTLHVTANAKRLATSGVWALERLFSSM